MLSIRMASSSTGEVNSIFTSKELNGTSFIHCGDLLIAFKIVDVLSHPSVLCALSNNGTTAYVCLLSVPLEFMLKFPRESSLE